MPSLDRRRRFLLLCCLFCALCLSITPAVFGQSYRDADVILNDIIKNASTELRPLANQSDVLRVYVTFNLVAITRVDEVRQEVACNAWLNFSWFDELRKWDPDQFGGIKVLHPDPVHIFRTRVMVSNSLSDRDIFKDYHAPVSVFHDGSVRWYPSGIFFTSCEMTMTIFPFDTHDCSIIFLSNGFYVDELVFEPASPEVILGGASPNGEWDVTSTSVTPLQIHVLDESFSGFTVTLTLSRRPGFFLLNVVLPIMLLSLLNFMVFVLPNDCGEKVSFGTTMLLSQAVYMSVVTDLLPQNSRDGMPLVLVYLFCVLVLCSLAVATSIVIVSVDKKITCKGDKDQSSALENDHDITPISELSENVDLFKKRIHPMKDGASDTDELPEEKKDGSETESKLKACLCRAGKAICKSNGLHLAVFIGAWLVMTLLFALYILHEVNSS